MNRDPRLTRPIGSLAEGSSSLKPISTPATTNNAAQGK